MKKKSSLQYRYESFGGIIASSDPPFLAHVDQQFMKEQGLAGSPLWKGPQKKYLSAPTEVHFAVTNRCENNCAHCYMDSGSPDPDELPLADFKKALDILSGKGVFHLALGGGEAFERPDFFTIAQYARQKGMVPNLTTNGTRVTKDIARQCTVFGQVNVSIDGVEEDYHGAGRKGRFSTAVQALEHLKIAGVQTGINCLVTNKNYSSLEKVMALAQHLGLQDVEFLRLKPAGRGKKLYTQKRLSDDQHQGIFPLLKKLSQKYKVAAKIDCSFIPMVCCHRPSPKVMKQFAVYGCDAGNVLLGVRPNGALAGCSFLSNQESVLDLDTVWDQSPHLARCRNWIDAAPPPCADCTYLEICKGGCRAVAEFVSGDFSAPDPECPIVVEFNQARTK